MLVSDGIADAITASARGRRLIPESHQTLPIEKNSSKSEQSPSRRPRTLEEIIISQLKTLRTHYHAVLTTESVDAVHKMRVTTRRLQASLDLLERAMKVRPLKRRLRRWRRKLSTVRNLDVFLEMLANEAEIRGRTRREQLNLIKAILYDRRLARSTKVKQYLQKQDVNSVADALGLLSSEAPDVSSSTSIESNTTDGLPVISGTLEFDLSVVTNYAADRIEQRLMEFQTLAAQSHPTNNPTELHQLRIAAKRVRYLLEIVSEMGYGDASRSLVWLRTLQDRIGDWHDLEALEEEIITIVSGGEFMKQNLSESGRMLQAAAHLQKKKERLVARLFPVKVPQYISATCQRTARSLRRTGVRKNLRIVETTRA